MESELHILRALCDETTPRDQRLSLMQAYSRDAFQEPEHQVVFESVCELLVRGPVLAARLGVHLNNRGFPDIDVEKYCSPPGRDAV